MGPNDEEEASSWDGAPEDHDEVEEALEHGNINEEEAAAWHEELHENETQDALDERPEFDGDGNEIEYDENGKGYVTDNDGSRSDPE